MRARILLLLAAAIPLPAQGRWIEDEAFEQKLAAACEVLRAAKRLAPCAQLVAEADHQELAQVRTAVAKAPARPVPLAAADLYDLLRASVRIVGHYYLCADCDEWHVSAASGFCVGAGGEVATCRHVLPADDTMREAFLFVATLDGEVAPVRAVLASNTCSDLCVLATELPGGLPLPLRLDVRVGERVYCLSNPDHQFGFFSEGIVARWYLLRLPDTPGEARRARPPLADAPRKAWLHVTCDFARGSSGAPIVDATGTVVGIAQSTTTVVHEEDADPVDTQMVFKTAAPAAALWMLLAPTGDGARAGDAKQPQPARK